MAWMQWLGLCLLAAIMTMLMRQMNPPVAALLCAAFGAMILWQLLPTFAEFVDQARVFIQTLPLEGAYYATMLRAMGIVLVTEFAAQVCRDLNEPSVAARAELCGKAALLGVTMPVFMGLVKMAVDVLQ